jgi:dienelactone hydrolase
MKRIWLAVMAGLISFSPAFAKVKTEVVEYKDGGTTLEGYLAYDDSVQDKRPGILVVHEWNGLGKYVQGRVEQLAQMGYVAFGADIYGKGVRPDTMQACQVESGKYKNDRGLMRQRAQLALELLKKNPMVDPAKLAAIGYCFGGTTVLELARSGADVKGVVSFHGALDTPNLADAKNIKGKVLVCQGGADSFTLSAVPGFEKEMKDAKVDYKLIKYKGAKHGFTNPAYADPNQGMVYNMKADKASWQAMKEFFKSLFKS